MAFSSSLFQRFPSIEYGFLGKNDPSDHPFILLEQIHSADVLTIPPLPTSSLPKADAWVTNQKDIYIAIKTADCVPVLFYDPKASVIGAAHAGWRGSLQGIIGNTIRAMKDLGASPSSIYAVIGPAIVQESYEVGLDVYDLFVEKDTSFSQFFKPLPGKEPPKFLLDLKGFVKKALDREGIPPSSIEILPLDTYVEEESLYSYRRSTHQGHKRAGDNISFLRLKP